MLRSLISILFCLLHSAVRAENTPSATAPSAELDTESKAVLEDLNALEQMKKETASEKATQEIVPELAQNRDTEDQASDPEAPALAAPRLEGYDIIQNGNNLELVTPWGRRMLFGDPGLHQSREYRLEIPLDALRPPKKDPPPAPPEPKREITAISIENRRSPDPDAESAKKPAEPNPTEPQRVIVEYDDSDRLIIEANRLYNRGKYYEASLAVEQVLARRPDHVRAWVMKGSLMFVQGHRDIAKASWEKALALDPANADVKNFLERLK